MQFRLFSRRQSKAVFVILSGLTAPVGAWVISLNTRRTTSFLKLVGPGQLAGVENELVDEDAPAGIVGAQFFGGNKEKEQFYDPVAEAEAGIQVPTNSLCYNRFLDQAAFPNAEAATLAKNLQSTLNTVIEGTPVDSLADCPYSTAVQWHSAVKSSCEHPLRELEQACQFYRHIDVAVTSCKPLDDGSLEFRWELSLVWPLFWEPRVVIVGASALTIANNEIVRQLDTFDSDPMTSIALQALPRFWDFYHLGMTPSAEIAPRLKSKSPSLARYSVYELPPRLCLQPGQLDTGNREEGNASIIPNHAFSCVIKTMGPQRQRYVPATPIEVQLLPDPDGQLQVKWRIPISVEYASNGELALPASELDIDPKTKPECEYRWLRERRIATVSYGGGPQDIGIAEVRKRLYDDVVRDGWKPKTDSSGRPIFFFLQNSVKACYSEEGLGMAVYEWRPAVSKTDEVAVELEW